MRRAASSIPMNLSEGYYRNSRNEYRHFVGIAKGSAAELKYQLLLSYDIGYLDKRDYEMLSESIQRIIMMLEKLNSALK